MFSSSFFFFVWPAGQHFVWYSHMRKLPSTNNCILPKKLTLKTSSQSAPCSRCTTITTNTNTHSTPTFHICTNLTELQSTLFQNSHYCLAIEYLTLPEWMHGFDFHHLQCCTINQFACRLCVTESLPCSEHWWGHTFVILLLFFNTLQPSNCFKTQLASIID